MVWHILFDPERCIYCHACEVACKQENDIPPGIFWIRIHMLGPVEVKGKLRLSFTCIRCMHCSKPPCQEVCPTKAIYKADGLVLINESLCIGCKLCMDACPIGAIQFNSSKNVVEKCTLCIHRIKEGLKPSCTLVCPTKALIFGDISEGGEIKQKRYAKKVMYGILEI